MKFICHESYRLFENLPDTSIMDNIVLKVVIAVIIIAIITSFIKSKKRNAKRNNSLTNGMKFEAHIIGVAHPNTVIDVNDALKNSTSHVLGVKMVDVTHGNAVEDRGGARVKISYIDPVTNYPTTVHRVLSSENYRDNRIFQIARPHITNLNKASIASWKYNQKLFASYRQNVNDRNIPEEEKKQLIKEAMQAMSVQYERPPQDNEGYTILNPPVPAEGYRLVDEIVFIQKTNTPILHDWTQGLR